MKIGKILCISIIFISLAASFAGISVLPAISDGAVPDNGIWLQTTGNQQWAYHPYYNSLNDRNNYSAVDAGTDYFTVKPGTSIYRKIIVQNKLSYDTSADLSITGLPASWVDLPPRTPVILSGYYLDNGTWRARPVGYGSKVSPQGFSRLFVTVPLGATAGRYPYTLKASVRDPATGRYYNTTLNDAIIVGPGEAPPADPPVNTPTPTSTPGLAIHEGFEAGYDRTVWVGSKATNYKKDRVVVDTSMGHDGTNSVYGLAGGPGENIYARSARNVSYGGHGFEFSAWIYVDMNEPPAYYDAWKGKWVGTSAWAGVVDVPAQKELLDDTSHYRVIGYNNRSDDRQLSYHIGSSWYRPLGRPAGSGWYKGVIKYDGTTMTFEQYDSAGNLIGRYERAEPGFTPRAVLMNAGSRSHRIDDLTYSTW